MFPSDDLRWEHRVDNGLDEKIDHGEDDPRTEVRSAKTQKEGGIGLVGSILVAEAASEHPFFVRQRIQTP